MSASPLPRRTRKDSRTFGLTLDMTGPGAGTTSVHVVSAGHYSSPS